MTQPHDPAFARPASEYAASGALFDGNDAIRPTDGLTKREYIAAGALAGILGRQDRMNPEAAASIAVEATDALIRALSKST